MSVTQHVLLVNVTHCKTVSKSLSFLTATPTPPSFPVFCTKSKPAPLIKLMNFFIIALDGSRGASSLRLKKPFVQGECVWKMVKFSFPLSSELKAGKNIKEEKQCSELNAASSVQSAWYSCHTKKRFFKCTLSFA